MKVDQSCIDLDGKITLVVKVEVKQTKADRKKFKEWLEQYVPQAFPFIIYHNGVQFKMPTLNAFVNYRNFECGRAY